MLGIQLPSIHHQCSSVGLECWLCVVGNWTLGMYKYDNCCTVIGCHLCIFYMCAVRPYLHSTCVHSNMHIHKLVGYFIETSLNNILALPYMFPPSWDHKTLGLWLSSGTFWWCVWCTLYLWGTYSYYFISFCFFFFLVSPKVKILHILCSAFTQSSSVIRSIFDFYFFIFLLSLRHFFL